LHAITGVGDGYGVGRHSAPEEPPPPRDKPRYRFVVAISGILLLAFLSMAVVAAVFPETGPQAADGAGGNGAANPFPQVPAGPVTPAGPPATAAITGAYELSQEWADGFIGAVRLTNDTAGPVSWQVRLVFPDTVRDLQNRWIAGGPGDTTVTRTGQTVVFDSQEQLAAGATIGLHFQFTKDGSNINPTECWVNGRPCS
jgi:hypothetical protein